MRRSLDRRGLLIGAGAAALGSLWAGAAFSAEEDHPAVAHMRMVAADLIAAQRTGTAAAFYRAISRHADLPAIALYGLGSYGSELPRADRPKFYRGVAAFMARYFADQSRHYRIAKADIGSAARDERGEFLVRSSLTLTSGSKYDVMWRLARTRGGYKVRDVKVLGLSLSFLQRAIFQSYIAKRGGDLKALVTALTR